MDEQPLDDTMGYLLKAMMGESLTSREKWDGPYTHSFYPATTRMPTEADKEFFDEMMDDFAEQAKNLKAQKEEHDPDAKLT